MFVLNIFFLLGTLFSFRFVVWISVPRCIRTLFRWCSPLRLEHNSVSKLPRLFHSLGGFTPRLLVSGCVAQGVGRSVNPCVLEPSDAISDSFAI